MGSNATNPGVCALKGFKATGIKANEPGSIEGVRAIDRLFVRSPFPTLSNLGDLAIPLGVKDQPA